MSSILLFMTAVFALLRAHPALGSANFSYQALIAKGNQDIPPPGTGPLQVSLSLAPIRIREVDADRGEMELVAWVSLGWRDWRLASLTNLSHTDQPVSVDVKHIWTPDVVPYDLVRPAQVLTPELAVIYRDGQALYMPGQNIRVACDDLGGLETLQGANCSLKFGSWTHSAQALDLVENAALSLDLEYFKSNPKYELLSTDHKRAEVTYSCCVESFIDITYTFTIRKSRSFR